MWKRCYSAGKLVNWSEGADEEKTAGYCQILKCQILSVSLIPLFVTGTPQPKPLGVQGESWERTYRMIQGTETESGFVNCAKIPVNTTLTAQA